MSYIGKTPTSVPLTSSDITDSIISLPKLTDGTDGNLISYDASGNPVAVATGTDGQVLTSTGAGSPPVFETLPAGGTNTPAFSAYQSSNQSISNTTETAITFNLEDYDTDSAFASNTFTVPSGKDGKYFLYAQTGCNGFGANRFFITINKSGTNIAEGELNGTGYYPTISASIVEQLSVGDTITARVYQDSGGTVTLVGNNLRTFFYGYRIIE
jgi:hypothetical protein